MTVLFVGIAAAFLALAIISYSRKKRLEEGPYREMIERLKKGRKEGTYKKLEDKGYGTFNSYLYETVENHWKLEIGGGS